MAANKFATILHKNTHKITAILVYAVLEWILIIFLLLNSLFTYLITKFANYFGLKPPCLWCSRVDHILEPGKNTSSYTDLICRTHATEISKLSYCSSHQRLAESENMCMECLATRAQQKEEPIGMTRRIAFISWVSSHKLEKGDQDFRCSCCNERLNSEAYPPYLLFKSSWGALDYSKEGRLIIEAIDDDNNGGESKGQRLSSHNGKDAAEEFQVISDIDSFGLTEVAEENCSRSVSNLQYEEKEAYEGEDTGKNSVRSSCDDTIIPCCSDEDDSLEIINLGSERNIDFVFTRVIPIGLIDSLTIENQGSCNLEEELLKTQDHGNETFHPAMQGETQVNVLGQAQLNGIDEGTTEKTRYEKLERLVKIGVDEFENSSVLMAKECKQVLNNQADQILSVDEFGAETMNEQDSPTEETNGCNLWVDQTKSKTLERAEAADVADGQLQAKEPISSLPCPHEDQSSEDNNGAEVINTSELNMVQNDQDQKQEETGLTGQKLNLVGENQEGILSTRSEPNEVEEEKFPDTPTSLDSFNYLHKKLLLLEKRESGTEESLDGSVVSEMECSDPILTIEKMKSALKAERKALSALYSELEEERSASAVAANQTMAMITRLQEEKAAMQMEALQYQRMMEEQAEYDQEALQLLNELMVKREKEKQELEKELEIYRTKVLDYETKEKIRMMRRSISGSVRSGKSSSSCSNSEDIDEQSIDLNCEPRDEEDSSFCGYHESSSGNTPADGVLNLEEMALDCVKHMTTLDESLTEFEEERLSILDQLKVLEEKLITIGDDEFIEDLKAIGQSSKVSVDEFNENHDFSNQVENVISNGSAKDRPNIERIERMSMVSMAKSLLPLLDAADNEREQGLIYEEQVEFDDSVEMKNSSISMLDPDSKRLAIEEEVDHVYERLQALEADREFLKHCMSSVKKGDKGMDLLQEILQHLRDLRAVELRVRNMNDDNLE